MRQCVGSRIKGLEVRKLKFYLCSAIYQLLALSNSLHVPEPSLYVNKKVRLSPVLRVNSIKPKIACIDFFQLLLLKSLPKKFTTPEVCFQSLITLTTTISSITQYALSPYCISCPMPSIFLKLSHLIFTLSVVLCQSRLVVQAIKTILANLRKISSSSQDYQKVSRITF